MKPVIFGLSGLTLTDDEKRLFRDVEPAGYILFKRNIEDMAQVRALTDSLRTLHGRDTVPILIDQEGGRVARMRPPVWPDFPAGGAFDALYDIAPITAMTDPVHEILLRVRPPPPFPPLFSPLCERSARAPAARARRATTLEYEPLPVPVHDVPLDEMPTQSAFCAPSADILRMRACLCKGLSLKKASN